MTTENTQENTPQNAPEGTPPGAAVQRRLVLAWLALSWERIWSRLWVVGVLFGLFAIVVLTDVLPTLHWALHALVILAAACGTGYLVWSRLKGFTWPTRGEARARLETTSPVMHRPLTTVEDTLVAGATAIQEWMWRLHQARAREDLDRLRVKGPAPGVAARDRFALRAAVVLALFVAIIGGWKDMSSRLQRGVLPMLGGDTSRIATKLWVTPPAYTNLSPIYVETPLPEGAAPAVALEIPEGSKVLAMVTGTTRDSSLKLDDATTPLEKLADETERVEIDIKPTKRIELRQSTRLLAGWDVTYIRDKTPSVVITDDPVEVARWHLRIPYMVRDDYGADSVKGRITKEGDPKVYEFPIDMPPGAANIFTFSSLHDLTSNLWAGERVKLSVLATDHAGHVGQSEDTSVTLPERVFNNPVAKELVKWRKGIAYTPDQTIPPALESVTKILQNPKSFGSEMLVQLTLITAKYRMANEPHAEAAESVPDLLWHAAVRIEDGNLVNAEQRVADAEKALKEAVERGATPEEIKRLLKELKEAVAGYGQALAEKSGTDKMSSSKAPKGEADTMDADLDEAMDKVEKLSDMGAEEAAKQALADLQEKLQAMREGAGKKNADDADVQKVMALMDQMDDVVKQQSDLTNDSFNMSNQKSPADSKGKGEKAAQKQEDVRQKLNDVMDQLEQMTGDAGDNLGGADQDMQDAEDALNRGAWKDASAIQSKASDKVLQGAEESAAKLLENLKKRGQGGALEKVKPTEARYSASGTSDERRGGEKVTLPTEPDTTGMAQRVRDILAEIRKRSADLTRPESEQDYLRRLKKQF